MTRRQRQAITVVLYTRKDCGLCRDAYARVAAEARGCTVTLTDIDTSDQLIKQYGLRIPVVTVNGDEIAEGHLEPGVVRAAVTAARTRHNQPRVSRWRFWA